MPTFWVLDKEFEAAKSNIRYYFSNCPLCGSRHLAVSLTVNKKDNLSCKDCNSRWHVYFGILGLKWAKLEVKAKDGKGKELLGKRLGKNQIKAMSKAARKRQLANQAQATEAAN